MTTKNRQQGILVIAATLFLTLVGLLGVAITYITRFPANDPAPLIEELNSDGSTSNPQTN